MLEMSLLSNPHTELVLRYYSDPVMLRDICQPKIRSIISDSTHTENNRIV